MPSTTLPRAAHADLEVSRTGDETLVYDLSTDVIHHLAAATAQVWELCDGRTSVQAAAQATGLTEEEVRAEVEQLRSVGLIADSEVNRRLLLQRAALVVGGATVASVLAPRLAYAVSGTGTTTGTTTPTTPSVPSGPGAFANTVTDAQRSYTVVAKGANGGGGTSTPAGPAIPVVGGTTYPGGTGGTGGGGAVVTATVTIPAGRLVSTYLGAGGGKGLTGTGGTGANATSGGGGKNGGGGGGALTGLFVTGIPIVIAGGGGGGGGSTQVGNGSPGGDGSTTNGTVGSASGGVAGTTGGGGGGAGSTAGAAGLSPTSGGAGGGSFVGDHDFGSGVTVTASLVGTITTRPATAADTDGLPGSLTIT